MRIFVAALALAVCTAAPAWATEGAPGRLERAFFGGESAESSELSRLPFWAQLVEAERADKSPDGKTAAEPAAPVTQDLLRDPRALLAAVNAQINAAPYVPDQENWGESDHWQTAAELAARGGDCEDYATAKYFALREAGVSAEAMRVALVVDEQTRARHAVLLVQLKDGVVVLDNLHAEPMAVAAVAHYRPLMAMNEASWQLADAALRQAPAAETALVEAPAPAPAVEAPRPRRSWLSRLFGRR